MSEAYSVYWPQDRWRHVGVAQRLTVLFGGPHNSEPSFRRATVQPGDLLYPIGVWYQVLYVFGRMRVQEIIPVDDSDQRSLDEYFSRYGAWRFLASSCTTEVVIGAEGTGIHLNRPVPGEVLKRLTYHPRRGLRPVKHVSEDGRLTHPVSVQGIYRLAESSAADLEAILTGAPGVPISLLHRPRSLHRPRRKPEVPANMDLLF